MSRLIDLLAAATVALAVFVGAAAMHTWLLVAPVLAEGCADDDLVEVTP